MNEPQGGTVQHDDDDATAPQPTPPSRPRHRPTPPPTYTGPERRQWDGSELSQLPMWARAVAIIGIPGAIAVYLVWVGSNALPTMAQQAQQTTQEITRVRELLSEQREDAAALFRMLQRVCSNSARTDDDRAKCFDR